MSSNPSKAQADRLKWSDAPAVERFIDDELARLEYVEVMEECLREEPDWTYAEVFRSLEARAIVDAQNGSMEAMADLIAPKNPLTQILRNQGLSIGRESEKIIADRLRGKRARRGRPPKSPEDIEIDNSMFFHGREVVVVQHILKRRFPDEQGHRDRAISIVAKRHEVAEDALANYLKKGKHLR